MDRERGREVHGPNRREHSRPSFLSELPKHQTSVGAKKKPHVFCSSRVWVLVCMYLCMYAPLGLFLHNGNQREKKHRHLKRGGGGGYLGVFTKGRGFVDAV